MRQVVLIFLVLFFGAGSPLADVGANAATLMKVVDVGDPAQGLAYAQKTCSGCHNVLRTGAASPNKDAPPFNQIANTPGMSITALTVWSRTSHPTMPNLVIPPNDIDNLIAYIMSLRDR
jgi:mono/diheme cytochrome c family protein